MIIEKEFEDSEGNIFIIEYEIDVENEPGTMSPWRGENAYDNGRPFMGEINFDSTGLTPEQIEIADDYAQSSAIEWEFYDNL